MQQAMGIQAFFTTKGKWAHLFMLDFPKVRPGERIEILLRYDKEDNGNYFGDMSDREIDTFSRDEQTFRDLYPTLLANWIKTARYPWHIRIGGEVGYTEITPTAPNGGIIELLHPLGVEGGLLYSVEGALRYDTRGDYLNTASGFFEEVLLRYSVGRGGDYNGSQVVHDHRHFVRLGEGLVFGQRLKSTLSFENLPFYEKPKLGSSRTVRGVSADRYRDGGRILLNSELRWRGLRVSDRRNLYTGLSLFTDIGHVFRPKDGPSLDNWSWGIGGGPRLYWYSTIVRMDYGVAAGNSAIYMRFAQVF